MAPIHPWPQARSSRNMTAHLQSSLRGSFYGHDRGSTGIPATQTHVPAHRNRSLVLNQKKGPEKLEGCLNNSTDADAGIDHQHDSAWGSTQATTGWISKRDRHMQLINASIYDKETLSRNRAIELTRQQKSRHRNLREKQKIKKHFQLIAGTTAPKNPKSHSLLVDGLRFQVCSGGSKLARERSTKILQSNSPVLLMVVI